MEKPNDSIERRSQRAPGGWRPLSGIDVVLGRWSCAPLLEPILSACHLPPHGGNALRVGQLEKVLAIEREIKRAQVTLLVRIKNKLTPEQQAKLVKIRSKSGAMQ